MRFAFSDEQEELRRCVRRVLDAHGATGRRDDAAPHDPALWRRLAGEFGLAGLIVPERHGGAGLGNVELVAVMEELGRALAPVPLLSTVCLATNAILVAGTEAQQQALLPELARGELTATVAWLEVSGDPGPAAIATVARPAPDDAVVLSGRKRYVLDGDRADLLIVAARAPDTSGADGLALYAVPSGAAGVRRRALPTMDLTRPMAELILDDVRLPAAARLGTAGWPELERVLALAAIGLAAEQVGGAQRCLERSVEYAKVRHQFGRPIGSFQAIQHACADMFVLVESARSAAYYAGWAADHAPSELAAVAATAASYCGDAFFHCASETIQVHGGIGFTWEHDAHLYFKRARASRDLFGTPAQHRERIAAMILPAIEEGA